MGGKMINIRVAYAKPNEQVEWPLQVEENCTVALAIKRSGILERFSEIPFPYIQVGIYGKKIALDCGLCDGDRIEIYRPLLIDPKRARLQRVNKFKQKD